MEHRALSHLRGLPDNFADRNVDTAAMLKHSVRMFSSLGAK
jgi:hypothetical protein